jgi:hypothetical protein
VAVAIWLPQPAIPFVCPTEETDDFWGPTDRWLRTVSAALFSRRSAPGFSCGLSGPEFLAERALEHLCGCPHNGEFRSGALRLKRLKRMLSRFSWMLDDNSQSVAGYDVPTRNKETFVK